MERTFNLLCEEMIQEWLVERKQIVKLYDSSKSTSPITSFHETCDAIGPSLSVFFTADGTVFGGYTEKDWKPNQSCGYKRDNKAFIFKLYEKGTFQPKRYEIDNSTYAIYRHQNYGPCFGAQQDVDGIELNRDIETKYSSSGFTVTSHLGSTYGGAKISNEQFLQTGQRVTRFEVYQLVDDTEFMENPWRDVATGSVEGLKSEVVEFQPPEGYDHVNILLVGSVGAGKSSYLNSLISTFKGHVTSTINRGSSKTSLTLKNQEYKIISCPERNLLKFRFWDTKGLEPPYLLKETNQIIRGNPCIKDKLVMMVKGVEGDSEFAQNRVHCIAFVMDGTVVNVIPAELSEAIDKIKTMANTFGIPQILLLTKIDKVCPMVDKNLALTFHSQPLKDLVDQAAETIGLPRAHVCPVKNYEAETELDNEVDKLILASVRQMLRFTVDHIEALRENL